MSTVLQKEIERRRTFAIISHPDAGKTTITEKLLLYGGAIQMAGTVKAKRSKRFATSDWMEIEKQRGISVTSSVMNFPYGGHEINLIDTPGHQDFSEDTYRTLTAVDCALMLIDAANGVEPQTIKLFEVCRMRKTPILAFVNKMDREGRDPFDLMDEIERVLGIHCCPMTWPIGRGETFRRIYDRASGQVLLFDRNQERSQRIEATSFDADSDALRDELGAEGFAQLKDELELVSGAGDEFDRQRFLAGEIAPLYFGSALFNFGVQNLLEAIINIAPPPLPREAKTRLVDPYEEKFSAFVFKVQANMNPQHRDRIAFLRICSGKFVRGMKALHVRSGREQRLSNPTQFMARDRSLVDEAVAGDIVGIHDPGIFKIADTFTEGEELAFTGIPIFAPEHFVAVQLKDPIKAKQLNIGLEHLSEEGAVQLLRPLTSNERYLGVVGALQFDVVKFRIENEYGVKVDFRPLAYTVARWITCDDKAAIKTFMQDQEQHICTDRHGNPVILLPQIWRLKFLSEQYPKIQYFATWDQIY